MKKISVIMSSLLAILLFAAMFFSVGNDNYRAAMDTNAYFKTLDFEKNKGISLLLDNRIVEDEKYQQEIYDIFKKYHVVAVGVTQYKGIDLQKKIVYVYAENDIYDGQIYTVDNVRVDFSDNQEKRYYSLHEEQDNEVRIDLLNAMYYDFVIPYEVHPFHQVAGNRMPTLLSVSGISVDEFLNEIKGSELEQYIENVDSLNKDNNFSLQSEEGVQFDPNNILLICMVLAFVTLILLVVVNAVKNKKFIAVCRLNGISKVKIVQKKFIGFLLNIFIAYSITQLLLLYFVAGEYRETSSEFYHIILLSILGFLILIFVLLIFVYLYLHIYRNFHDLKQNKINAFSIRLNIIVKIFMTAVLIAPFVSLVPDFSSQLKQIKTLYDMKEENENRYSIMIKADEFTNEIGGDKAIKVTSQILSILADKHNAKLYNMMDWYVRYNGNLESGENNVYQVPLICVNINYLEDYAVKDYETGKDINLNLLKGGTFLVPKEYDDSESLSHYEREWMFSQKIIVKDFENQFKPLNFKDDEFNSKYIKNPIVYVCDEDVMETVALMQYYYYVNTDDLPSLYDDLSERGFKDNITFNSLYPSVQQAYNKQFVTFSSMAFLLIGYLTVYLVFVYQSIYVYLDVYKRKISVQYLNGFSYFKRYYEIYIINACAYLVAAILAYIIYQIDVKAIIMYILFFGAIEAIFETYQIHQFQNKDTIQSLK